MKSLLMIFAVLSLGAMASATTVDKTVVLAVVTGMQASIQQVAVLADGRLQIKDSAGQIKVAKISAAAVAQITQDVQALADVEVTVTDTRVICAMKPKLELSNLEISNFNSSNGKYEIARKTILTAQSCAFSHKVIPTEEYAVEAAMALRAEIVILALNAK